MVATVPTVYGIETIWISTGYVNMVALQQYLPFTVLKRTREFGNPIDDDT